MPLYFCYFHSNNRTASRASHFGLHENYMHVLAMCPEAGDGRRSNFSFVILFYHIFFSFCGLISMINWLNITISWSAGHLITLMLNSYVAHWISMEKCFSLVRSCFVDAYGRSREVSFLAVCWKVWCSVKKVLWRRKRLLAATGRRRSSSRRQQPLRWTGRCPLHKFWQTIDIRIREGNWKEKLPRVFWLHCYYFSVLHA